MLGNSLVEQVELVPASVNATDGRFMMLIRVLYVTI